MVGSLRVYFRAYRLTVLLSVRIRKRGYGRKLDPSKVPTVRGKSMEASEAEAFDQASESRGSDGGGWWFFALVVAILATATAKIIGGM